MSVAKHTPGPWCADGRPYAGWSFDGGYLGVIRAKGGELVYAGPSAFGALRGATREEADANARLIASAPGLLDAARSALWELRELQRNTTHDVHGIAALEAAIAMAEGDQ